MNAVDEERGQLAVKVLADEWRIGIILIRSGRLKKEEVIKIVQRQRQAGIRFGDAAIELGVLDENDVRFALAQQFDYSYATHGESSISKSVIAAYEPHSVAAENLRALRSQLMLRWFDSEIGTRQTLAIAGVDRGVGRSWLAANLAVTFSQLGKSTILIDGDLRHSMQHQLFGLDNQQGLSEILCGRASAPAILKRNEVLPNLSLITAGTTPPNPQEVIARGALAPLLESLKAISDVIIIDTPANSQATDGQIIAKHASGALLMVKRHKSRAKAVANFAGTLRSAGTAVVFSVLVD